MQDARETAAGGGAAQGGDAAQDGHAGETEGGHLLQQGLVLSAGLPLGHSVPWIIYVCMWGWGGVCVWGCRGGVIRLTVQGGKLDWAGGGQGGGREKK